MAGTMGLITPTTTYDGFDQVDIVVEAVFENMDLKKTTFSELAGVTRADCILASNTSTLDIDEIARAQQGTRSKCAVDEQSDRRLECWDIAEAADATDTQTRGRRAHAVLQIEGRLAPRHVRNII